MLMGRSIKVYGVIGLMVILQAAVVQAKRPRPDELPPKFSKAGPALVLQWCESTRRERDETVVDGFLRIRGPATKEHLQQLAEAGFVHRSVISDSMRSWKANWRQRRSTLLTGSMSLAKLSDILSLPFVESVDSAIRVNPKKSPAFRPTSKGKINGLK